MTKKTTNKKGSSGAGSDNNTSERSASSSKLVKPLTAYEDKIAAEIDRLIAAAQSWLTAKEWTEMAHEYEVWYSDVHNMVRQILPHREADFVDAYRPPKRKGLDVLTYGIRDYLDGLTVQNGFGKPAFGCREGVC